MDNMVQEANKCSSYKRLAFTIENLARSSRDEMPNSSPPSEEPKFHGINRSLDGLSCGQFIPNLELVSPNFDRLTPVSDPGYTSLTISPSKSESTSRKRRRCSSESEETNTPESADHPRPRPASSSSPSDISYDSISPYTSDTDGCSDDQTRAKKARTAFSSDQVYGLEQRYQFQKYLPSSERSKLAKKLQLADQQVKTWFQNRRMKEKRHQRDEEQTRNFYLPTGGVDLAQLHALGLPCPPPYKLTSPRVGNVFSSPSGGLVSGGYQFMSHLAVAGNGPDHIQMHPGYLYNSPIVSSLPVFSGAHSPVSHHAHVPSMTSTPVTSHRPT